MKLIPNWQSLVLECAWCGTMKSVKYELETQSFGSGVPKKVCICNKCALAQNKREAPKEEIQYYIIKNPDTGLYYRGKGVNRWGKYLNQASIFRVKGQVIDSCEQINRRGEKAVIIPIKIIEEPAET